MCGIIILIIQNPFVLASIIELIIILGLICLYVAQELDKKDELKKEKIEQIEKQKKEEKQEEKV